MALGARAIALVALATTLLLAGWGGEDGVGNRLTLTDDTCTYEGETSPSALETFEADLENQSSKLGAFEIARIEIGGTFATSSPTSNRCRRSSRTVSGLPGRRPIAR